MRLFKPADRKVIVIKASPQSSFTAALSRLYLCLRELLRKKTINFCHLRKPNYETRPLSLRLLLYYTLLRFPRVRLCGQLGGESVLRTIRLKGQNTISRKRENRKKRHKFVQEFSDATLTSSRCSSHCLHRTSVSNVSLAT